MLLQQEEWETTHILQSVRSVTSSPCNTIKERSQQRKALEKFSSACHVTREESLEITAAARMSHACPLFRGIAPTRCVSVETHN